jgi:hypothetical protein
MPFSGQALKNAHIKNDVKISAFDRAGIPEDAMLPTTGTDGL